MTRTLAIFILAASIQMLGPRARADRASPSDTTTVNPQVSGEVVVQFSGTLDRDTMASLLKRQGFQFKEGVPSLNLALAAYGDDRTPLEASAELASEADVEFAHPNYLGKGGDVIPDDTWFPSQWHHDNTGQSGGSPDADIDSVEGWELTRGSPDIVVAVLDTGIDSDHPEFAGRFLPGFDFVNEDADPEADHSHGPLVTGLLAAAADNDFSVAGVDHNCTILPVKVLDESNLGTVFDLIQGIDYAAGQGADVISMSLIDYPPAPGLENALSAARSAGSVLVACGGNGGFGDADASWPGASEYTMAVGWTDDEDVRSGFSGTGNALDFVAPGVDVLTIRWDSNVDLFTLFSGCSAATPITAGVVSLCLALDPTLTHDEIEGLLIQGADDEVGPPGQDTPGWDPYYGHGRVNMNQTLALIPAADVAEDANRTSAKPVLRVAPNPFADRTTVSLRLPAPGATEIAIHGVNGHLVRTLRIEGPEKDLRVDWNGRDDSGAPVPAGVYFVRATSGGHVRSASILLLH